MRVPSFCCKKGLFWQDMGTVSSEKGNAHPSDLREQPIAHLFCGTGTGFGCARFVEWRKLDFKPCDCCESYAIMVAGWAESRRKVDAMTTLTTTVRSSGFSWQ